MKTLKWILVIFLLAGLILTSLLACGAGGDDGAPTEPKGTDATQAEPTEVVAAEPGKPATTEPTKAVEPEPTQAPVAETTVEPTATAEPEPELDASVLAQAADFDSYRSTMSIKVTGVENGEQVEQTFDMFIEETRDPEAQHIVVSGTGLDQEEAIDSMELYQVEGTVYMRTGDQWSSYPADAGEDVTEGVYDADTFLGDTCGWKRGRDTQVDGVEVEHWTLSKKDLDKCLPPEEMAHMGELTDAGGDLYVAKDGGYVVQMDFYYVGKNLYGGIQDDEQPMEEGRMDIHMKTTDVNAPFTIEVPEEALASSGTPEDIPTPPDAEEVTNMFGMISFVSPSTADEIADFYKAEMPKKGWTEVSVESFGGMHMLEYSKDGRTANFMISTDEDAGNTSVLITVQEPE